MTDIKGFKIKDPVTDLQREKFYAMFQGALANTYQPNVSTSYSNNQITFSAPPPSPKHIVSRNIKIGIPLRLVFTGNTGDVTIPLLNPGVTDAPRAFPGLQIMDTAQITFNNNTVSMNVNDIFDSVMRYAHDCHDDFTTWSTSPSYQDQHQDYADGVGTLNNPLAGYSDQTPYGTRRGSFPFNVVTNTSTQAIVEMWIVEILPISPIHYTKDRVAGFYGLQTFNFIFNLGNLTRAWSHTWDHSLFGNVDPVTNVTGSITGITTLGSGMNVPMLFFQYITPQLGQQIADVNAYDYYDLTRYPTEIGLVGAGANGTANSQNIQLNQIVGEEMELFMKKD